MATTKAVRCSRIWGSLFQPRVALGSQTLRVDRTTLVISEHPSSHLRHATLVRQPASAYRTTIFKRCNNRTRRQFCTAATYSVPSKFTEYGRPTTMQVDPLAKKQALLSMVELHANENGRFVRSYQDRLVSKSELATETGLSLRDLRNIADYATHVRRRIASIITRPSAIIVHMDPVQAIVEHDKIRLFYLRNETAYQVQMKDRVVSRIRKSGSSTFEFRALEALLIAAVESLDSDFDKLHPEIVHLLDRLVVDQSAYQLLLLKNYSDKLSSFEADVSEVASAITMVLNNDEDMAQMYLTNAYGGIKQAVSDHTEVEMLLESFSQQVQEIDNRVQQLKNSITNSEEYIRIHFDSQRNRLMRINLLVSMATLAVGTGAALASLFGMNLTSGFEAHPQAFYLVGGSIVCVAASTYLLSYRWYSKTKERVPSWGKRSDAKMSTLTD